MSADRFRHAFIVRLLGPALVVGALTLVPNLPQVPDNDFTPPPIAESPSQADTYMPSAAQLATQEAALRRAVDEAWAASHPSAPPQAINTWRSKT